MAIIQENLDAKVMRNKMESKEALATKGALYVGTGDMTEVTPNDGGDAVNVPITSSIAPNGADDNGKVLVADSNETVGWKLDVGANIVYKKMSGSLPTSGWNTLDEGWKGSTLPASRAWLSVIYGDGKYVAIAQSSSAGAYSTDGITWTEMIMPAERSWQNVTYGDGKFVAVAWNSANGAYSTDGISWTGMTLPASRNWNSVTYGGGKFVAVAYNSTVGAYSTDGITWTEMSLPASRDWISVTYGGDKFVAVASGSDKGAYSTNGINWTEISMLAGRRWSSVTYGNGKFVAVADSMINKGAYSTDGISWTEMTLPASGNWSSVTYGGGKFIAVVNNSSAAAYSTDGMNWSAMTMPASSKWQSVTYGNGKFVAVVFSGANGAYWKAAADVTYTISDTSITANTSVKMYLTDEGGVKAQSKASGSITVIRDSVPTTPIPYEYEVEQTSAEGLFEVINGYVPTKTSQLTNDSGFITAADIPRVGEWITVPGQTATLTEAGTYQVINTNMQSAGATHMQSIVYWDGTTEAYGTRDILPSVTQLDHPGSPVIYCAYPYIDADGQLSVRNYNISTQPNSSVWTKTSISNSSGFKYRKIH